MPKVFKKMAGYESSKKEEKENRATRESID